MWAYESVFYQIYPLGFCGAPYENDGVPAHRINRVLDFIPHIKKLGVDTVRRQGNQIFMRFDMRFLPELDRLNAALDMPETKKDPQSRTSGLCGP